jgi:hypothetical protein
LEVEKRHERFAHRQQADAALERSGRVAAVLLSAPSK